MGDLINTLAERKARIEQRLKQHGIPDLQITSLDYLNFNDKEFATPYETGCRIIILFAIAYTIEDPSVLQLVEGWLKGENLWSHASPVEQQYFAGNTGEEEIDDFLWQVEGAYILSWAVGLTNDKPAANEEITDRQLESFVKSVPRVEESVQPFLTSLAYRNTTEIFDENVFYELTTAHFRDLLSNRKEDTTDIDRVAAFQRHRALNWLRRFSGSTDWDETDTST